MADVVIEREEEEEPAAAAFPFEERSDNFPLAITLLESWSSTMITASESTADTPGSAA